MSKNKITVTLTCDEFTNILGSAREFLLERTGPPEESEFMEGEALAALAREFTVDWYCPFTVRESDILFYLKLHQIAKATGIADPGLKRDCRIELERFEPEMQNDPF